MLVILALEGDASTAVFDRLVRWSAAAALKPFCWWRVGSGAPGHDVEVVRDGQVSERTLPQALERGFAGAALILPVSREAAPDIDLVERLQPCVQALRRVAPPAIEGAIRPTLMVVPQDVGVAVPEEVFSLEWAANLVVLPEDRRRRGAVEVRLGGPNQLPAHPELFPAHAANALVAVTGLWRTPHDGESGRLAALARRQPNTLPVMVQPSRSFTDMVDFGYLPDQLAARVFQVGAAWPNPDLRRFAEATDPARILDHVADRFWNKHQGTLAVSEYDPITLPAPPTLGILEALRQLAREVWARIVNKPAEVAERFARAIVDGVAVRIERAAGADAGWRVVRWDSRPQAARSAADVLGELDRPLFVADGPFRETWRDLRAASFGLIDGADLPSGLGAEDLKREDRRLVVTDPGAIAPDPRLAPRPTEDVPEVFACDPLMWRSGDAEGDGDNSRPHLPEETLETFRRSLLWRIGARLGAEIDRADVEAADPEPAPDEAAVVEAEAGTSPARRGLLRRWGLPLATVGTAGVAIASSVVAILLLEPVYAAAVVIGAFFATIATYVALARAAMRRRDRADRQDAERLVREVNEVLLRQLRAGDQERLARRYREFLKWSDVIGRIAHSPWVGEPLPDTPLAAPLREDELPAATDRRVPSEIRKSLAELSSAMRASVFEPRWLSGVYVTVERSAMLALVAHQGADLEELQAADLPDPAADQDEAAGTPLNRLRAHVSRGDGRHLGENPLAADLLRHLSGTALDALAPRVLTADELAELGTSTGQDAGSLPPSAAWFEAPGNLEDLGRQLTSAVVRVVVQRDVGTSGGTGFAIGAGRIVTARHVIEGATAVEVEFADGQRAAAEVAMAAPATDLAVLRCDHEPPQAPLLLRASDEPARLGEPVVTLGFPQLLEGDATLSWGLVSAEHRVLTLDVLPGGARSIRVFQASFPASGGASGSPVVDLEGRVIGVAVAIEQRTDADTEYMSFAVPADELARLVVSSGSEDHAPEEAPPRMLGDADAGIKPSELFATVRAVGEERVFMAEHWTDPTTLTRLDDLLSAAAHDGTLRTEDLVAEISYRVPMVAIRSQVELSRLAHPTEIIGVTPRRRDDADDEPSGGEEDSPY